MTSQQRHLVLMQGGGHLRAEATNSKKVMETIDNQNGIEKSKYNIDPNSQTVRIDDFESKRSVQVPSVPQSFPSTSRHCSQQRSFTIHNVFQFFFRQVTGSWMCSLAARCFRQDAHVDVNSIGSSKDLARHKE